MLSILRQPLRPTSSSRGPGAFRLGSLVGLLVACVACMDEAAVHAPRPADLAQLEPAVAELVQSEAAAVEEVPTDASRWGRLAMVYEENRLFAEALTCYAEADGRDEAEGRWSYRHAITLEKLGRVDEAIAEMGAFLERWPGHGVASWRLGKWQLELGELDDARATFEAGCASTPDSPAVWTGLGRVHLLSDSPQEAIEALERARDLKPKDDYVRQVLGYALRAAGRSDEPEARLDLGDVKPTWEDPWEDALREFRAQTPRMRAKRLGLQGKVDEAVAILEAELARAPDDVNLLSLLAQTHYNAGDFERAIEVLLRCIEAEPRNVGTYVNLVKMYSESGRPAEALEAADKAIELRSDHGQLHRYRGQLLNQLGRFDEGCVALRRAIALDDRDLESRLELGWGLLRQSLWDEARSELEPLTADPGAPADAFVGLAWARLELGQRGEAREALDEAAKRGPETPALFAEVHRRWVTTGTEQGG